MPAAVLIAIQLIEAAITEAPQAIALVQKGKDLITSLVGHGLISAAQQNLIHNHLDAYSASVQAGETPFGWAVEPDPV